MTNDSELYVLNAADRRTIPVRNCPFGALSFCPTMEGIYTPVLRNQTSAMYLVAVSVADFPALKRSCRNEQTSTFGAQDSNV